MGKNQLTNFLFLTAFLDFEIGFARCTNNSTCFQTHGPKEDEGDESLSKKFSFFENFEEDQNSKTEKKVSVYRINQARGYGWTSSGSNPGEEEKMIRLSRKIVINPQETTRIWIRPYKIYTYLYYGNKTLPAPYVRSYF